MQASRGWIVALATVCALVAATAAQAQTQTVTATWDRNTDAYTTGYRLYYGTSSGSYSQNVNVGNAVSHPLTLSAGTYYFVVRAYNTSSQLGPPSNEVTFTVAGPPPPTPPPPTPPPTPPPPTPPPTPPPGPVNCVVSAWAFQSATAWGACTGGQRSRTETWARTVVTPPANGGAACPALTQTRTATQTCSTTTPAPTAQLTATLPSGSNRVNVSWQTTNATSVTLNGARVSASGSQRPTMSGNSMTFTLVATGAGGSETVTRTVTRRVDCVLSAWSLRSATEWGACNNGQQTRTETWARTVVTAPSGGGRACGALQEQRVGTRACTGGSTPTAPGAPAGVSARVSGTLVTLNWTRAAGGGAPTGYFVSVGTASGASNLLNLQPVGNTLSVAGHVPRGTYYARVKAANAVGASPDSTEIAFRVGAKQRPRSPLGLTGGFQGSTAVLSWAASAGDDQEDAPTGFILEAGSAPGLANLATVRLGDVANFQAVVPRGTYYVRLRAINELGVSDPSAEIVLRPEGGPGRPGTLSSSGTGSTLVLTWRPPSTGAVPHGYVIEAGSAPGLANLAVLATGNVTTFSTTAPPGVYYVRVRGILADGTAGDASNEIVVRR